MRTHRTDWLSLIFALIFLAVAAWWLLAQLVHLALPQVGWIVAVALIAIGTLGLVGALRSNRDLTQPAGTSPAQATETGCRLQHEDGLEHRRPTRVADRLQLLDHLFEGEFLV